MARKVKLHGYRFSVYNRVALMALHRKQVTYERIEVNPFAKLPAGYLALHPFGRVPVLSHGAFAAYETNAITRYIDSVFPGEPLRPENPKKLARMNQVIAVVDNYGYVPMVRQVFSHRVFRPLVGEPTSDSEIALGLKASTTVLSALEKLAAEQHVLTGQDFTLADCHLAPVIDYFVRADIGKEMLSSFPALSAW